MPMNPRLLRPLARRQAPAPPADPFATLVSTKSTGNISGNVRSGTGYIKVEWWDSTTNVYGTGVAGNNISWSKAAGGAGSKTLLIYPSDASGNLSGALTSLDCFGNSLTSLDVSGLTALAMLNCKGNPLTSLRAQNVGLSGGFYYSSVSASYSAIISDNQLGAAALDQFYTDLAAGTSPLLVFNNPGTAGDDPSIATNKGYTVYGS